MNSCFISIMLLSSFYTIVNSYSSPIRVTTKKINSIGDVRVYEPFYKEENNDAIIFFTGGSGFIPDSIYTNVLSHISSLNVSAYIYNVKYDDNSDCCKLLTNLRENHNTISLVGHSSGCMKAISYAKKNKNLNSLILFDAVDDRFIYEDKIELIFDNFFRKNRKGNIKIDNIEKCLFVKSEKSYIWQYKPFKTPFIPFFDLKPEKLDTDPKRELILEDYGHSDILDNNWSSIMHKTLDEGTINRDIDSIDNYHEFIAQIIVMTVGGRLSDLELLFTNSKMGSFIKHRLINH